MNNNIVIKCQNLVKHYRQGSHVLEVLKDINLQLIEGERVAIIGASGSGKSTLLNMLGGLDLPDGGSVSVVGHDFNTLNDNERGRLRLNYLGFVYQFHHLLGEFTALENVAMPLLIAKQSSSQAKLHATEFLERVGLIDRLHHKPSELSGGERQRVAIARALVTNPKCVLMDEPTGNLDQHTADAIHQLMSDLNKSLNTCFVIVTHDQNLARRMDKIYELKEGGLMPFDVEAQG